MIFSLFRTLESNQIAWCRYHRKIRCENVIFLPPRTEHRKNSIFLVSKNILEKFLFTKMPKIIFEVFLFPQKTPKKISVPDNSLIGCIDCRIHPL